MFFQTVPTVQHSKKRSKYWAAINYYQHVCDVLLQPRPASHHFNRFFATKTLCKSISGTTRESKKTQTVGVGANNFIPRLPPVTTTFFDGIEKKWHLGQTCTPTQTHTKNVHLARLQIR
jgi:hypothetical protein